MSIFTSVKPRWKRWIVSQMLNLMQTGQAAPSLTTPLVHLLKATVVFNSDTPIATLTAQEATFTGYVAQALPTLSGPVNTIPDTQAKLGNNIFIVGASPTITNSVYGYYIDHNTAADWVLAELFPTPLVMALAGDFIDLNLLFPFWMFPQTA